NKPSIVFVHGIRADASSFSKLIPTLQAEGQEVIAAQYGLHTLAGDVAVNGGEKEVHFGGKKGASAAVTLWRRAGAESRAAKAAIFQADGRPNLSS
ncbi:MAG TPA: hypothetical protein VH350_09870, partial [Candidatus Sulfotelmatobacter sp.]|nr:hypothetical protein [Candidatus Sulfotelmatobacter sp.]